MRYLPAFVALVATATSLGAQELPPTTIYASGRESYRVEADAVEFQILVEGHGNTAMQALAPCLGGVDSVRATLSRLALPTLRFDLIPLGVAPAANQYGQPVQGERFLARTAIRVRLTDLRQLPRVTAAALDAGAARTAGFRWSGLRADSVHRVAQEAAVAEARSEAETVARALGGSLGGLRTITVTDDRDPSDYYQQQDQTVQTIPEIRGSLMVNISWDFIPARR